MIYAGVNGYLDALPVAKVRSFEDGLLSLLRGKNVDILNTIRDTRDLSDETAAKLKTWSRVTPRLSLKPLPLPLAGEVDGEAGRWGLFLIRA